jgi:hypothetical protein
VSEGAVKVPLSVVTTTREAPVSLLVIVTVAFWMTAPEGSVTVPVIVPVGTCAKTVKLRLNTNANSPIITSRDLNFMCIRLLPGFL